MRFKDHLVNEEIKRMADSEDKECSLCLNEYEILLEGFAARVSEMGVSVTLYRLDS